MAHIFNPSPQQQDFFNWVDTGTGSLVLEAVAGAGKSTTLVKALQRMRGSVSLVVFNKNAVKDLKAKFEDNSAEMTNTNVRITTMHGAGYSAWARHTSQSGLEVAVDELKVFRILDKAAQSKPEIGAVIPLVLKLVSFAKQLLIGVDIMDGVEGKFFDVIERFSLDADLPEDIDLNRVIRLAVWTMGQSHQQCRTVIDYDDMIYAPVAHKLRMFQNDWVLIDEAQDTNPARRALARMMLKPNGRLVAVGDSKQAIYGFTGADSNALDLIAEQFRCARLPLTVIYRCPKAVVAYAHQWVSHIQAHETAPEGEVRPAHTEKDVPWYNVEVLSAKDAILCRYTRPLVGTAFALLRKGHACRIEGRDIGKQLVQLIRRWKSRNFDQLTEKMDAWVEKEKVKAEETRKPARLEAAQDRVETVKVFIERCRAENQHGIGDLIRQVEALFGDDVKNVTVLSTIHKAKGREWPRVFWIQTPPSGRKMKEWEIETEICCNYVAATRAQEALILVPMESRK